MYFDKLIAKNSFKVKYTLCRYLFQIKYFWFKNTLNVEVSIFFQDKKFKIVQGVLEYDCLVFEILSIYMFVQETLIHQLLDSRATKNTIGKWYRMLILVLTNQNLMQLIN